MHHLVFLHPGSLVGPLTWKGEILSKLMAYAEPDTYLSIVFVDTSVLHLG